MRICDIMTDRVISIEQNEPVSAAAKLLRRYNIGSLPVCDGSGKLRGILTDRDIVTRCVAGGLEPQDTKISEIMSRGVVTASPFDAVECAVRLMSGDQVRRLPVVDNGRLVGMVTLCDMARDCACEMEASETLAEISSNFKRND